jgi:DNA-binding LacI/PurR family transcriptional regulator
MQRRPKVKKNVTLRDVALHAGVSQKTVSNVINDWPYITDETREKVQVAIKELGYRPSMLASSLRTGRTNTIGVMITDITNPFFGQLIHGIEEVLSSAGYGILLANTNDDLEKETSYLERMVRWGVDGLMVFGSHTSSDLLSSIVNINIPIVSENLLAERANMTIIAIDNLNGGYLATKHLIELGCKRIAHLGGSEGRNTTDLRFAGYQTALEASGMKIDQALVKRLAPSIRSGFNAAIQILREQHPDGIFCYNDLLAIGVLVACRRLGLRVPEDVAVIGFDDIAMAALVEPGLSTIRIRQVEMGRQAGQYLLERMKNSSMSIDHVTLPVELVVRRSTSTSVPIAVGAEDDIDNFLQTDLAGLDTSSS